jgi:uncharacterized protein YkwD
MNSLAISIMFCLVVGDLVDALSRLGEPYAIPRGERKAAESWLSSLEEELSKKNIGNSDEDFERRSAQNQQEQRAYDLTNAARKKGRYCGSNWYPAAQELAWNDQLADAARRHANDMLVRNYFSHTSMDGRSFTDRIKNAGYKNYCYAAENIAGNSNADATVDSWLKSPGHCSNIMSGNVRDLGVGYASGGPYGGYWVQNFAKRC